MSLWLERLDAHPALRKSFDDDVTLVRDEAQRVLDTANDGPELFRAQGMKRAIDLLFTIATAEQREAESYAHYQAGSTRK